VAVQQIVEAARQDRMFEAAQQTANLTRYKGSERS